jgi:hypothetical protein
MSRTNLIALCALVTALSPLCAQQQKTVPSNASSTAAPAAPLEQPDARRVRDDFSKLLGHYSPTLRDALATDPTLLSNQSYLTPYPQVAAFVAAHPEIQRDPGFYVGTRFDRGSRQPENTTSGERVWSRALEQIAILSGLGMVIGLLVWLIRTLIDYRRWNRLTKIQTDAHTKILDRFTGNEDMLAYIKSPAGSRFLESAPISLDAGPRSISAPVGRILWSVQAGVVLIAGGLGLLTISGQIAGEAAQPIRALGLLGAFLGLGFLVSSGVSYFISKRLGLLERNTVPARTEIQVG